MRNTLVNTYSHTQEKVHALPQREISWLLKYNYLTAACHLGRHLDRLFLSVFLPISFFLFLILSLCISLNFSFPLSGDVYSFLFLLICPFWNITWQSLQCWFDSIYKCFIDIIFNINSHFEKHWIAKCSCVSAIIAFTLWNSDAGQERWNLHSRFLLLPSL